MTNTSNALNHDELAMFRELVRNFVSDELIPLERLVQEREATRGLGCEPVLPVDKYEHLVRRARELDLSGIDVPKELGGQGLGAAVKMIAVEELNRSIVPFRLPPESPNLFLLIETCNEEQREKYLRPYACGEKQSSLALTEPNAGSDAAAIESTAVPEDGGWLLNGSKAFTSFADVADFFIIIAVTDHGKRARGGISAFLVDAGTPGLTVGPHMPTMGEPTPYDLYLDDCWIPSSQLLGEPGYAFVPLSNRLGVRRVEVAARCIGMAERLMELMVAHATDRITFGQPLASRQAIQWWIADTEIEIHTTRLLVADAAGKLDAGIKDIRKEASITKVFGTEMVTRVADRAIQLYGGMGFSKELPIEWIYRNSRFLRVVDGASEIHRMQLARARLGAVSAPHVASTR